MVPIAVLGVRMHYRKQEPVTAAREATATVQPPLPG
jgi:hypothetical protein